MKTIQHMLVWMLFVNIPVFCLYAGSDLDAERKKAAELLVKTYFNAVQQSDTNTLAQVVHFQSNSNKTVFLENAVISQGLELKEPVVVIRPESGVGDYFCLVSHDDGLYYPETISIIEKKGVLQVEDVRQRSFSSATASTKNASELIIRIKLDEWKRADGATLQDQAAHYRQSLLNEIIALEYAAEHDLEVTPAYGGITQRRDLYQQIANMSDADLRTFMMFQLENLLEEYVDSKNE